MKNYYVYIVKCSDNSYYVGVTNNVERRLNEHNLGKDVKAYTFSKRPVKLVWVEMFSEINEAILREKKIKGWSRLKKEALINEDWDKLVLLSKNHSEHGKPKD